MPTDPNPTDEEIYSINVNNSEDSRILRKLIAAYERQREAIRNAERARKGLLVPLVGWEPRTRHGTSIPATVANTIEAANVEIRAALGGEET